MNILGLDLSTNASGWCVFDNKKKIILSFGAIHSSGKDIEVRTKEMCRRLINEVISKKNYDLVVICAAPFVHNPTTYLKLKRIEYIIQGHLFMSNIPIKEISDNQWSHNLNKNGRFKLQRETKKELAVKLMAEYLGNKNIKVFWSNGKCLTRLRNNNMIINDDMADAFCVGLFYDKVIAVEVQKDQEQLAKEARAKQRAIDRKAREKARLREIKRKNLLLEAKEFKKIYDKTGNKTALNSYKLRIKKAEMLNEPS